MKILLGLRHCYLITRKSLRYWEDRTGIASHGEYPHRRNTESLQCGWVDGDARFYAFGRATNDRHSK